MPHYGLLRDYKFEDTEDLRGAEVYGVNNEKLGKIDDVVFDHTTGEIRYAVIDTGGLLTSHRFLVPINRIQPYGNHQDKFYAELDKERIEMLPEFNEDALRSEQDWERYQNTHDERWKEGAVLYNRDTGRIITPPPQEQPAGPARGALSDEAKRSLQRDFTPQKLGRQDDLLGVASSGDDVTVRPTKPSIAGREDVIRDQQPTGQSLNTEGSRLPDREGLLEPGIYRLDDVPEAEKKSDMNEPLNANYGQRWTAFQDQVRRRRDKIVGNCRLCGSQEKVA